MAWLRLDNRCDSESVASLPWLWSIQHAASCKEMDVTTLQSLVDVALVGEDGFCEKTRELISLRCLEAMFDPDSAHRVDCDDAAATSLDSRVRFAFSTTCGDVLRQIVGEVPVSNIIKDRVKLLKWDVSQFILHKRAVLKCDLVQLKESILDGTHPNADCLREAGRLQPQNGGCQVHLNGNAHCDLSKKDNGNCTYHANKEVKENSITTMLEKVTKQWKELLEKIKSCKRNQVESVNGNEHMTDCQQGKQVDISEWHVFQGSAKKIRHNESLNVESNKEKPISHGVGRYDRWFASKQLDSRSHNEVLHHEPQIPFSATMSLQHKSGDECNQEQEDEPIPTKVLPATGILHGNENDTVFEVPNVIGESESKRTEVPQVREPNATDDKAVEHTVNGCVIEVSSDETMGSDNDISESSSLKETNGCMRCKKDGKLLVCRTTTCSTMIHASCLTTSPHFDAEGDFFCPYCVYAKSISIYIEAKTKFFLARQGLERFICNDVWKVS
ncbi:uncharacterized protein LOC107486924 [Arachis duranensis]|uniref:Uncharacterized protein LOC107486924 n=1 Tax=Arachis duranensis TaxID=130453 RepID=A0A6P4D649_ARADU|nr:uncharacterized protein LOC107486924 [Arachis duranensis]